MEREGLLKSPKLGTRATRVAQGLHEVLVASELSWVSIGKAVKGGGGHGGGTAQLEEALSNCA